MDSVGRTFEILEQLQSRCGDRGVAKAFLMKRNLLLLSASAAILLCPAVSLAEPQHPGGQAQGGHAQGGREQAQGGRQQGGRAQMSRATTFGGASSRAYTARAATSRAYATPTRQVHHQNTQGAHAQAQTRIAQGGASAASHGRAPAAATHSRDVAAIQGASGHAELNRNVQAAHAFQAGPYRQPQGYSQRRWSYGEQLPGAYYARDYWLTDFALYGLFGPPDGLVWVRVGPDALLIDQYNGQIVQVDYGVFA
jgi:Ni/Co efflux regulator RcnB